MLCKKVVVDEYGEHCVEVDLDRISGYFTCALCNQFFRNAVTLTECVHTFCEKCVMDYLTDVSASCPACQTAATYVQVKPDTSIRSLLNKFFGDELIATTPSPPLNQITPARFQGPVNPPTPSPLPIVQAAVTAKLRVPLVQVPSQPPPPPSVGTNRSSAKRVKQEEQASTVTTAVQAKDAEEKLSLFIDHLHKKYTSLLITLPSHYTVKSVGKYLSKKRNVEATAWICNGNVLQMNLTVGQVKQLYWRPDEKEHMKWIFQTKDDDDVHY